MSAFEGGGQKGFEIQNGIFENATEEIIAYPAIMPYSVNPGYLLSIGQISLTVNNVTFTNIFIKSGQISYFSSQDFEGLIIFTNIYIENCSSAQILSMSTNIIVENVTILNTSYHELPGEREIDKKSFYPAFNFVFNDWALVRNVSGRNTQGPLFRFYFVSYFEILNSNFRDSTTSKTFTNQMFLEINYFTGREQTNDALPEATISNLNIDVKN